MSENKNKFVVPYGVTFNYRLLAMLTVILVTTYSGQAMSRDFRIGNTDISVDAFGSYTSVWRVAKFDEDLVNPNTDDGNRNFRKRGQVQNVFRGSLDLEVRRSTRERTLGAFTRGLAFIDTKVANSRNDHDSSFTNNANEIYGGPLSNLNKFTDRTKRYAGADVRVMDAFVYGDFFQDSNSPVTVRVGRQVVNWGESLFIQSGITNAINPADASMASVPGTEVRDILWPTEQLFLSLGLTASLSVQGYYQFKWHETIAPPAGSYLSSNDFIGPGGASIILDGQGSHLRRGRDIEGSDSGQLGAAIRWDVPWNWPLLGGTELGLYYINYHSKIPQLTVAGTPHGIDQPPAVEPGEYYVTYFDDVELYGLSFNTLVGNLAVSGEAAYHRNVPVQTLPLGPESIGMSAAMGGEPVSLATRENLVVGQLTLNQNFNQTFLGWLADDVAGLLEVGVVHAPDLRRGEVFRGPNEADPTAWGYRARTTLTYFDGVGQVFGALSGTDFEVEINFSHDVDGVSPIPAGSFTEKAKALGINLTGRHHTGIEASVGYSHFWDSPIEDRDFVSLTVRARY